MKNILILANENERAAIACLRSLKRFEVNLYLAFSKNSKMNKLIFNRYLKKDTFLYNKSSKKEYIDSLINIQKEIGEYFLFNFGDEITRWTIECKSTLNKNGIDFKSPNLQSFDLMLNKSTFIECTKKYGLDIPKEISAKLYLIKNEFGEKFVIKAKSGVDIGDRLLKAPLLIESKKSLVHLNKLDLDLDKHFVQEYINGPSIYYCAYYESGNKKIDFVQKNVSQQPGGKSVIKAHPYKLPIEIVNKIDKMMKELKWDGAMMIELKQSLEKFYVIECNPRLWGPLQLAVDNGVDFPSYICGLKKGNIQKKNNDENNYGYLWVTGYLIGILYMLQTKTKFQFHPRNSIERIKYKDIWFRKDTYSYFFIEFLFIAFRSFRKILTR